MVAERQLEAVLITVAVVIYQRTESTFGPRGLFTISNKKEAA